MTNRTAKIALYCGLAAVFVCAFSLAFVLPASAIVDGVAGSVGVSALIAALFQMMRDRTAFERSVWMKREDQQFSLGVTSHMANVVFDKHVEFCESYMAKLNETFDVLLREGPSKDALTQAYALHDVRRRRATWLTDTMSEDLEAFEAGLRSVGASAHFLAQTHGHEGYAEQRSGRVDEMHRQFGALMPIFASKDEKDRNEKALSIDKIIRIVRDILDVDKFVEMRRAIVHSAHTYVSASASRVAG